MKLYLIDDDKNILNILKLIIADRQLGEICGTAECGLDALDDFVHIKPDIVLVDLLMPEIDGISLIKRARPLLPDTVFVMLSQVSSKDMIASAYEAGVEFYMQKPINSIEVESVIKKVCTSLTASRTLQKMQSIFTDHFAPITASPTVSTEKSYSAKLKNILQKLGIMSEKGSYDIITVVEYIIENNIEADNITLNQLCSKFSDNPKSMEQRIRRTANIAMVNLAHLGLEDYGNEIFTLYSNSLFNFEQIRYEMDFIRGKTDKRGNIKIKKFINGLVHECSETSF